MKPTALAIVMSLTTTVAASAGGFPTLPILSFPETAGPSVSTQSGPVLPLIIPADQ